MLFDSYLDFFKNLAVQNKAIGHMEGDGISISCFHWILVSADPWPNYYLNHLEAAQKNRLPIDRPFMVLENYIADPDIENDGDNKIEMMGAFMILQKVQPERNIITEASTLANTEKVARQIISRMKKDMRGKCQVDLLNKFKYEHIGPAMGDQYFGTKVFFNMVDAENGLLDVVDEEWLDLE
jgi:hypothetical protein